MPIRLLSSTLYDHAAKHIACAMRMARPGASSSQLVRYTTAIAASRPAPGPRALEMSV